MLALLPVILCSGAELGPEQRMQTAIRNNNLAELKSMIAHGANVNAHGDRGVPLIMYAAAFGSPDAFKILLDAGADVNAKDALDATALMWSVAEPEKVRLSIAHGADVNAKSKTGRSPLMLAALHNGSDAVVDQLLAKGADVHAVDARGLTFLGAASAACNPRQVRIAVANHLDVNAKDALGFTPLMNAAGNGDPESVRILLAAGADVNAVSAKDPISVLNGPIDLGYYTALMLASFYGPPEIVEALLHAGAKLDPKDIRGRTALHYSVSTEAQDPRIVSLLLKAGADPVKKDLTSETAVEWAAKYAHPEVMRLLRPTATKSTFPVPGAALGSARVSAKEAIERSLPLLESVTGSFMEKGGCIACHAQTLTAMVAKYARPAGFKLDEAAMQKEFADHKAGFMNNGGRLLLRYDGGGGIDTLDYAMLYFEAAGYPGDAMTDAIVANMVAEQMADGSWIRGGAVQRAGPSPAARAPMQDSDIVRTALSLHAIKLYGWEGRKADLTSHINLASSWLLHAKPLFNEEFAMQLLGLHWAQENRDVLLKFARRLIDQQRSDGGWSQNPYLESDSYATGETLFALRETGALMPGDAVYQRGLQFLLSTQHEDGSWHVKSRAPKLQPYFQSGFPYDHDQWISMAGTQWATLVLAQSLR
jgi:ankyrin repeat protein